MFGTSILLWVLFMISVIKSIYWFGNNCLFNLHFKMFVFFEVFYILGINIGSIHVYLDVESQI